MFRRTLGCVFLLLLLPSVCLSQTVLVLPFQNETGDTSLDWISESISETVREMLAGEGKLVLSREERQEAYHRLAIRPLTRLTRATLIRIGESLDATHLVYGRFGVFSEPDKPKSARIHARLLDLTQMSQSREYSEIGLLDDLASLQDQLAWQTLKLISPESAPSAEEFRQRHPTIRVDAIENYIRGLLASQEDLKHKLFTQAARLDSRYSQPCYEVGRLHWDKKAYREAAEWLSRVTPGDPNYLRALFLLGVSRYQLADFEGARASFATVAEKVPLNEVFNNLGAAESRLSRPEALETFQKALEGDPADPAYHFNVGLAHWKRKNFDAAADCFRATTERDPSDNQATIMLGRCLLKSGPRPGDRSDGMERLKTDFEESAYRSLKAALEPRKK